MRQSFKDQNYFNKLIEEIEDENRAIFDDIESFEKDNIDYNKAAINYELFSGNQIVISSLYSMGKQVDFIIQRIKKTIIYFIDSIDQNDDYSKGGNVDYAEILEIVSMGVLIDPREEMTELTDLLSKINYPDYIISFLVKSYGSFDPEKKTALAKV